MKMKNTSDLPVTIDELGLVIGPGGTEDIDDRYAKPRRYPNGSRQPSVIEMLAPQLRPASKQDETEWMRAPDEYDVVPKQTTPPTATDLIRQGIPAGVAEHAAKRRRAEWEADQARQRAQTEEQRANAVEMQAAKVAAKEEDAWAKHEDDQKEDDKRRQKLSKQGKQQLDAEADAEKKRMDALRKQHGADGSTDADRVTLADLAHQTAPPSK